MFATFYIAVQAEDSGLKSFQFFVKCICDSITR